jgi:hypothetical protein
MTLAELLQDLAEHRAPGTLTVVIEVHGQQYDIDTTYVERNATPEDRLVVIRARQ